MRGQRSERDCPWIALIVRPEGEIICNRSENSGLKSAPDLVAVCTNLVYTASMRNITFSANEDLIDQARQVAHEQRKTLNDAFRDWLAQYAASRSDVAGFDEFMGRINPMRAGRHFTREEMNER
jgi:hypothetical protein